MSEPLALLVPGGHGQVGSDLVRIASTTDGVGVVDGPGSAALDVTDAQQVRDRVASFVDSCRGMRAVVINAAAYTDVDAAETHSDRAYAVNAIGPALLATACAELRIPLLHISTDYVFSGNGTRPHEPHDATGPLSVYGRTKLAGERAALSSTARAYVVRTSWVYGATGNNFVKAIARLERTQPTVSVVDDQQSSPTWSADLARALLELAAATDRVPPGVLHCTNAGSTSRYGLARAIFEELGADPDRVKPCSSADHPRPARRPAYSVLSSASWTAAGLSPLRHWRDALAAAFASAGDALRAIGPESSR